MLATCYLRNCMSPSVLHAQISHSIPFLSYPLFCLPPLVFGCVCFVHVFTPEQDLCQSHEVCLLGLLFTP